jgi:hypothetical protein
MHRRQTPCLVCCRAATGQAAEVHPQRSKRRKTRCRGAIGLLHVRQHLNILHRCTSAWAVIDNTAPG